MRGVIVGKFYPPHRGHNFLIETAARQVEHLTVIVCAKPEHTISGELRGAWLRETHPNVEIMVIDDKLGDDDTLAWAAHTIELLGGAPDVVFTSEHYGEPYARAMNCRHVLVDLERQTVPCSGTMTRENPLQYLEFLAPPVRAYFVKKVCVVGAESSGTTTISEALARHYQTVWVPEYGREYCEQKFARGDANIWQTEEFVHIAKEQSRREDLAARIANKLLICDTNAWATAFWHARYLNFRAPEVEEIAENRRYDLYLLTNVDIPFVQDGLRDGEHIREAMHQQFEAALQQQSVPWARLSGPHETRMLQATKLIDELLKP